MAALGLLLPLLAAPASTAMVTPTAMAISTEQNGCYDTAIHGGLGLGLNKEVTTGGPNFTSGVCRDINVKLATNAAYRTYAMACLETSSGVNCPKYWTLLDFNNWQILRSDVLGNTRWQIRMYADSPETVNFDYTA
jgi:hypothetical protein